MITMHSFIFVCHILLGSMAIILFWIPVATQKGCLDHVKFGRYYSYTMYAVALSGALMSLLVIYAPLQLKGYMLSDAAEKQDVSNTIRIFWGLLLYLSLFTYNNVKQGFTAIKCKLDRRPMQSVVHVGPIVLMFVGGLVILGFGIYQGQILNIAFGLLGIVISYRMLKFCFKRDVKQNQWLIEHFAGMIGSGIGAYTAFITFGGRHLFENFGALQIAFWVAPGIVGSIAIAKLSRKYQHQ